MDDSLVRRFVPRALLAMILGGALTAAAIAPSLGMAVWFMGLLLLWFTTYRIFFRPRT